MLKFNLGIWVQWSTEDHTDIFKQFWIQLKLIDIQSISVWRTPVHCNHKLHLEIQIFQLGTRHFFFLDVIRMHAVFYGEAPSSSINILYKVYYTVPWSDGTTAGTSKIKETKTAKTYKWQQSQNSRELNSDRFSRKSISFLKFYYF